MPTIFSYSPVFHAPAIAGTQLATTCRYARYAETHPVQPLKGFLGTRAASVSYRALVPAGHAGCGVALAYRALSPDGENQKSSFKALPDRESIPATPPPFRHTSCHPWPRLTTTVWRNLLKNESRPVLPTMRPHVPQTILNSEFLILNWTYTFSAKERDLETGLSYFGSRYYSSDLSIWLSVDPMSDKYPSLSPYTYCADNPVRCVDPNGDTVIITLGLGMKDAALDIAMSDFQN